MDWEIMFALGQADFTFFVWLATVPVWDIMRTLSWYPDAWYHDAWYPDILIFWYSYAWYPDAWYPDAWYPDDWYPDAWYTDAWYADILIFWCLVSWCLISWCLISWCLLSWCLISGGPTIWHVYSSWWHCCKMWLSLVFHRWRHFKTYENFLRMTKIYTFTELDVHMRFQTVFKTNYWLIYYNTTYWLERRRLIWSQLLGFCYPFKNANCIRNVLFKSMIKCKQYLFCTVFRLYASSKLPINEQLNQWYNMHILYSSKLHSGHTLIHSAWRVTKTKTEDHCAVYWRR